MTNTKTYNTNIISEGSPSTGRNSETPRQKQLYCAYQVNCA